MVLLLLAQTWPCRRCAYVSQGLNLRGVPLQAANIVCNKILFREFLKEHDFPVPENIPTRVLRGKIACLKRVHG